MDGVVDCLAPASGVSGLGRHIGKEKKILPQKKDAFGGRLDGSCFHLIFTIGT